MFQCSSASRKFLNRAPRGYGHAVPNEFQCSSASRKFLNPIHAVHLSSPLHVSVLFSEPKIPQPSMRIKRVKRISKFQCSSASRKFLNFSIFHPSFRIASTCFSALQRAENSSTPTLAPASIHISDRDDHASSFLSLPGASP